MKIRKPGAGTGRAAGREKGKYDLISFLRASAFLLVLVSFLLAAAHALSPQTSFKEFLDRHLLDSLDGDMAGLSPGDEVVIHDRIWKIETTREGTVLYLESVRGTEYYHTGIPVDGSLPPGIGKGDTVEIRLLIGRSEKGNEILLPLEPEDIKLQKGGMLWP
ncbi:MAG: hypothetical protein J7L61_01955 [Thermoplasmata archaeon]|nr:hypothetical protein [Thermoplasmata archaeon]